MKRGMFSLFIVALFLVPCFAQLEIFVDGTNGNDSNPGTQNQPLKTIQKAQSYIRNLGGNLPPKGVTVQIRKGDYFFADSPLQFTSSDSGNAGSPVVYTAYTNEKVRLSGGIKLPNAAFKLINDPSMPQQVAVVDLKALGITNYGEIETGGLGQCNNNKLELYFNSQRMYLARYPNIASNGTWMWDSVQNVTSDLSFQYSGNLPSKWVNAPDLWLHGYWSYDWADNYVKVDSIDITTSTFNIDSKTPPLYGLQNNSRFYALNLIEELDAPGEYYLDRSSGKLYFYPPNPITPTDELFVSMGQNVVTVTGSSYFTIHNLNIEFARIEAVLIQNANNFQINNCFVSNNGASSISLLNSLFSSINSNTITGNGCSGIYVNGGDQKTLTPGKNGASNNQISYFAQWQRTYNPGIGWGGVGNTFTGNYIHDGPHTGILGGGNNCIFQGNHLANLCYEVVDSGAFYTGRSWITRGNVVRGNLFENIQILEDPRLGSDSVQAIYLDDQMSGYTIENNVFKNCMKGVFIGGGRRNIVKNNNFTSCAVNVHVDNRGMNWQNASCASGGMFQQQLESVNYQQPPWSTAYPELVNIMKDYPCVPVYNDIENSYYCGGQFIDITPQDAKDWLITIANNNPRCNSS